MLLHTESFDTWVNTTQMLNDYASVTGSLGPGRNGNGLAYAYSSFGVSRPLPAEKTEIFVGYCHYGAPYGADLFRGMNGALASIASAYATPSGAVSLRIANDSYGTLVDVAVAPPGTLKKATQQYLEYQVKIHPTEGILRMRVDRTVVAEYIGNTLRHSNFAQMSSWYAGGVSDYTITGFIDDLYICDSSGDRWNTFRGDIKVLAYPMTGAGAKSEWTSSTANPNWQNIDELGLSDTDYNSSDTVGARDLFTVANTPTAVQVHALRLKAVGMRSDTSPRGVKVGLVSGVAESFSAEKVLSTGWAGMSHIVEVNPATGLPFTPAELALVQPGYELAS